MNGRTLKLMSINFLPLKWCRQFVFLNNSLPGISGLCSFSYKARGLAKQTATRNGKHYQSCPWTTKQDKRNQTTTIQREQNPPEGKTAEQAKP